MENNKDLNMEQGMAEGPSIRERLCEAGCEDAIILDPKDYDKAIVGYSESGRVVYSHSRLIMCLMEEGMSIEEAVEYIDFNIIGGLPYMGTLAPIVMYELCADAE